MKIALVGYGRMGSAVDRLAVEAGHEVVARLDQEDPISSSNLHGADVAIEFTTPSAAPSNLVALAELGIPTATGTTGWFDHLPAIEAAVDAGGSGLVYAPNFSMGAFLFNRLVQEAARLVDGLDGYDVSLHEIHHRGKVDHPSGTARSLAELLVEAVNRKDRWEEGPPSGAPDPRTLWVSVGREGSVPGTHTVALDSPDDRITLSHEARSRDGFARGAITAAEWIASRKGVHSFETILEELLGVG